MISWDNGVFWNDGKGANKTWTHSKDTYTYDISSVTETSLYVGIYKALNSNGGWGRYDIYNFYLEQ